MQSKKRLRGRPKSFHDKSAQNRIQALDRAMDVMECLAEKSGMTLTEIAAKLQQSPATIYRVLSTFETRQVVETDASSQEWFIGPASFRLGSAFLRRTDLVERARPLMRELMEETGETANLGTEVSGEVMFISQVETHENIRAFFPPGAKTPMHASGIGKALLAHAVSAKIEKYISQENLETFTEHTICHKDELYAELNKIKAQGFAFDDEEKNIGMRCIAAPIFNFYGEVVAGISISGPTARLSIDRINLVSKIVMVKAEFLSTNPKS
jgi:IclR family acetate operon transcriptional repressor